MVKMHALFLHTLIVCKTESRQQSYAFFGAWLRLRTFLFCGEKIMGKEQELTGYPSIDKPWLKYYTEDAISIALPERTIYEHIYQKNQDNLDRICLSYYGTNITYRQFFDRIDNIANAFESYCVKENDIVTLSMINSPECICALFALSKIGAVANTVTPMSSSEELAQIIKETNSHVVITLDIFQDK